MNKYDEGAIINVNRGSASWSTSKSTAQSFSKPYNDGVHLVFISKTQSKGTSIKHISKYNHEDEVLVSKNAKYRVTGKPKNQGKYMYVHVEEV